MSNLSPTRHVRAGWMNRKNKPKNCTECDNNTSFKKSCVLVESKDLKSKSKKNRLCLLF